jgi:uncharacterized membrane protein YhaH (DUF805 family)
MNFLQAYASVVRKYSDFSGRASRAEYWNWVLFVALASECFFRQLDAIIFQSPSMLTRLFVLVIFIPTVAVGVRRLHDVDRSGWWLLLWPTFFGIFSPLLFINWWSDWWLPQRWLTFLDYFSFLWWRAGLLGLTFIGIVPLLVWWIPKGTEGANRFGPDPLDVVVRVDVADVFS